MEAITWQLPLSLGLLNLALMAGVLLGRFRKNLFLARKSEQYLLWLRALKEARLRCGLQRRALRLRWNGAAEEGLWELLDSASSRERLILKSLFQTRSLSDALGRRLRSGSTWEQARAALMLGRVQAREALARLVWLLERGRHDAQLAALTALERLGQPAAIGALVGFLAQRGARHSRHVLSALIRCGLDEPGRLLPYLTHRLPFVRTAAAGALAEVATSREVPALLQAASDQEPQVRAHVARALGRTGDACGFPALERLLADPVWYVRLQAAGALSQIRLPAVCDRLLHATCDPNWLVRDKAAAALYRFAGDPVYLLRRVQDELRDRYALEALVSVLEREGAIWRAIHHVCSPIAGTRQDSQALITELFRAGRCTSALYALETHPDPAVRQELLRLVREHAVSSGQPPLSSLPEVRAQEDETRPGMEAVVARDRSSR